MANELTISENSGAASGPATSEGNTGGAGQGGFASLPANPTRKAEIEAIMKTDFARYEDEGLDKEYLALLQGEIEAVNPDAGNPTAPAPANDVRTLLCGSQAGQKLVYEWERAGGFKAHLENVQREVGAIVKGVGGNREQRAFMERFSRSVPAGAELAMMDEIASGAPGYVQPASAAEVAAFASAGPAGKLMVSEWGSDAPTKVAILRSRAQRMNGYMDEDDAADFWAWFEDLDTAHITKIYRKLAGG